MEKDVALYIKPIRDEKIFCQLFVNNSINLIGIQIVIILFSKCNYFQYIFII